MTNEIVNTPAVFTNEKFGSVRIITREGESWFVAKDVCDCLGITNSRDALSSMDEDEKGVATADTLGGKQEMQVVNESGLYSLIFRSRKPEVKEFKRWVTHEVLPSIRKTGQYRVDVPSVVYSLEDRLAAAKLLFETANLSGNQLTLAIDKIHRREVGYSALEVSGQRLVSPKPEVVLTPTEIGKQLDPVLPARVVNSVLGAAGYQEKIGKDWQPTAKAEGLYELLDVGKSHNSGTPVKQLKWYSNVVDVVRKLVGQK